jgi:hypothetical protein
VALRRLSGQQTGHDRAPLRRTLAGRGATPAADGLIDPVPPTWFDTPQAIAVEFSSALVSAFAQTGHGRTPEAAADVLLNAATTLQNWQRRHQASGGSPAGGDGSPPRSAYVLPRTGPALHAHSKGRQCQQLTPGPRPWHLIR